MATCLTQHFLGEDLLSLPGVRKPRFTSLNKHKPSRPVTPLYPLSRSFTNLPIMGQHTIPQNVFSGLKYHVVIPSLIPRHEPQVQGRTFFAWKILPHSKCLTLRGYLHLGACVAEIYYDRSNRNHWEIFL